ADAVASHLVLPRAARRAVSRGAHRRLYAMAGIRPRLPAAVLAGARNLRDPRLHLFLERAALRVVVPLHAVEADHPRRDRALRGRARRTVGPDRRRVRRRYASARGADVPFPAPHRGGPHGGRGQGVSAIPTATKAAYRHQRCSKEAMMERRAGHPISIEVNPNRVRVLSNGRVVADTMRALTLRE